MEKSVGPDGECPVDVDADADAGDPNMCKVQSLLAENGSMEERTQANTRNLVRKERL